MSERDFSLYNEGPNPSSRGNNIKIAKIYFRNLIILFSRTTGPMNKTCNNVLLGEEDSTLSKLGPFNSHNYCLLSPNQSYRIKIALSKCVY